MINTYLTDKIKIVPITKDLNSVITEGTPVFESTRVKYKTVKKMDENGREVHSSAELMLLPTTVIKNDSRVYVTEIDGRPAPEPTKKYIVIAKETPHGFSMGQAWVKVWIK